VGPLDPNRAPSPPPLSRPYVPPVPATAQPVPLVIHTNVPRRRSRFDLESVASTIGALILCMLVIAGVGWFVHQWWQDVNAVGSVNNPIKPAISPAPVPPVVNRGGGLPAPTADDNRESQAPGPAPGPKSPRDKPTAREHLEAAVKHAREQSFGAALELAQKAKPEMPEESDGLALMVAYVRQYLTLADDARLALNGSSELDLGPKYGRVQFIEQNDTDISFFSQGRRETLPIRKFNSLPGVRFRVTRDYLDRAKNPANDLILGSYNFLLKVDANGVVDAAKSLREAERRFRTAIASGEPTSAEQATVMMKTLQADLRK
jgi:hypothetical protein